MKIINLTTTIISHYFIINIFYNFIKYRSISISKINVNIFKIYCNKHINLFFIN